MNNSSFNAVPFLRTSREFPEDIPTLVLQISKTYIDIANAVNSRTIGLFTINKSSVTGESYYIEKAQKQQGFRQVYTFTALGNIPHGISTKNVSYFTNCFGAYTDGTNWYGAIFASNTTIAGQVSFYITPTIGSTSGNIVVQAGAGSPAITKGIIVLQWIANP